MREAPFISKDLLWLDGKHKQQHRSCRCRMLWTKHARSSTKFNAHWWTSNRRTTKLTGMQRTCAPSGTQPSSVRVTPSRTMWRCRHMCNKWKRRRRHTSNKWRLSSPRNTREPLPSCRRISSRLPTNQWPRKWRQ